jgi:hypothetical protein
MNLNAKSMDMRDLELKFNSKPFKPHLIRVTLPLWVVLLHVQLGNYC